MTTPRRAHLARLAPPLAAALALLAGAARGDDPGPDDRDFFEARVRPILEARCLECHAAGAATIRGGLRLDDRAALRAGGDSGPAVEPGDPDASLLVQAVRYDDAALRMPPKGKLPDAEIAALEEWVRRGAPDPRAGPAAPAAAKPKRSIDLAAERKHWAYQPLADVAPPAVTDESWVRNPIDRFILARLEAEGLAPAPEADRRTLLRRLSFDLVGLPPAPEEAAAFPSDPDAGAYEALVDRLLESPRFGERWARHWLDLARWAESHGFEHDYDRPTAWPYRDFVVEAFNRDLPFDTFARWQIAGDEIAPDEPLALAATGFLGAGTHATQITKNQVEKERYDELDDMVATTGTAFLGLSIGCARCHDHKYDPIASRDYYRMAATFTTTVRSEVDLVPREAEFRAALAKHEAGHRPYVEALARFEAEELPGRLEAWEASRRDRSPGAQVRWVVLDPSSVASAGGATATEQPDGSVAFTGTNPEFDTYTIVAACDLAEITALKVEALADPGLVAGGPGRAGNGNFALTDVSVQVGPRYGIGATRTPGLANAKATFEQPGLPVAAAVDGDPKSGWAVDPQFGRDHAAVFELASDTLTDSGCTLTVTLKFENNGGHNIGRLRLSATDAPRPVGLGDDGIPPAVRATLDRPRDARTPEEQGAALAWFRTIDTGWRALAQAAEAHAAAAPKPGGTKAMICTEGLPAVRLHTQGGDFLPETHVLRRGDPSQKESVAEPGFLPVLEPEGADEARWRVTPPEGSRTSNRRRALAAWLTDADAGAGALLARVIVNRLWQHHFGRGIVATPSDFGTQGDPPSHPELLDWLARELIRGGWKLKPIHRLMVTSATYRQGLANPAAVARDPENRLVARLARRRLEAEPIRDALLACSGLLDPRAGGPGTLDERMRRRAIYFTIKRSHLVPFLTAFDAPDALVPIADRSTTTVAPQALLLLNSPIVREWAEAFARRVAPEGAATPRADAVARAFLIALSRPPRPDESSAALAFLERQEAAHRDAGAPNPAALALADFCQVLMSTNEFLFVD